MTSQAFDDANDALDSHHSTDLSITEVESAKNNFADEEAETLQFEISAEDEGARLDAFLAGRIAGRSRERLKRAIEDGDILVDGQTSKPAYRLRAGDRLEVEVPALPIDDYALAAEPIPLEIIYEDEQLVVINKPAGLVVHPGAGAPGGTLANALRFHFNELAGHTGTMRPGIVHRLDRDTSGLIVVAKTEGAHVALSEQFRTRTVFKSYVALVHGRIKEERGTVEEPIARDPRQRTRMCVSRRGGRPALTLFRVRRVYNRFTLLDVEIKTGRTHQIRVHLAWLKHPVVADAVYGAGRDLNIQDARLRTRIQKLGRQFLHAETLRFRHPETNAPMRFRAEMPPDLSEFLDSLNIQDGA